MKVDLNKLIGCNVEVLGKCNSRIREEAIECAIGLVQQASDYLDTKYIGVKNYARFGDDREDHDYGMCPRYGSIVFEISKKNRGKPHTDNDIYCLLVARDNPNISLGDLIKEQIRLTSEIDKNSSLIATLVLSGGSK